MVCRRLAVALLLLATGLGGCARRSSPYRFRAALVTSVSATELHSSRPHRPPHGFAVTSQTELPRPRSPASGGPLVDALRARVGDRVDRDSSVAFALELVKDLDLQLDSPVTECEDGLCLGRAAVARQAFVTAPVTGDLVLFDRVIDGAEASWVAVVVSRDARGTTEFVGLRGGGRASRLRQSRQARRKTRWHRLGAQYFCSPLPHPGSRQRSLSGWRSPARFRGRRTSGTRCGCRPLGGDRGEITALVRKACGPPIYRTRSGVLGVWLSQRQPRFLSPSPPS